MKSYIVLCFALLVSFSAVAAQPDRLRVVATTTIIADVAQNVGGDLVEIAAIVPVNTDIHAFQPSPSDVVLVAEADLILVNGAGLESFLGDLLENASRSDSDIVVVSNGVSVLAYSDGHAHEGEDHMDEAHADEDHMDEAHADDHSHGAESVGTLGMDADCGLVSDHDHEGEEHSDEEHSDEDHADEEHADHDHGPCDPHFWTNPQQVMIWVDNIAAAFAAADPDNAEAYMANAAAYMAELQALDAEIEALLAEIPEADRVIVTNHEFLAYFADRYDFEIVGVVIPGGTTQDTPTPQALAGLIEVMRTEGVSAIFAEVSDSSTFSQTIAAEIGSEISVVRLYSDSLSSADEAAASYLDYMRYNASAIASALS